MSKVLIVAKVARVLRADSGKGQRETITLSHDQPSDVISAVQVVILDEKQFGRFTPGEDVAIDIRGVGPDEIVG